jgi:hypothetical protein
MLGPAVAMGKKRERKKRIKVSIGLMDLLRNIT